MAEAILLADVEQLGERGEVIDVASGYLRNYLIPRKLAQPATRGAIDAARAKMEAADRAKRDAESRADEYAGLLSRTVLTIPHKAGEDGKLYGSVTSAEIVSAIKAARDIKLDKRKVRLEEPIKQLGTHMVTVEITTGVTATIKTIVVEEN